PRPPGGVILPRPPKDDWKRQRRGLCSTSTGRSLQPTRSTPRGAVRVQPAMQDKVRGRDIIAQVVENMRSQGEELRYSTIVPAAYDVYLHPADFQRLESLAGVIADQARRALDEELDRLNHASRMDARVREALGKPRLPHERAGPAWEIRLISDPNEELAPGDILVDSTLVVPANERPS